ncbi:TonB-dependent receptor [Halioglobus japonicus]|uniref:TonB-dependent receptor n=2 Tax=Halioglobus TaxID=1217416 RepID=A0AAP8SQ57_9GAMM|nr:TonB-dependent receptor [Halioglobus japonicus]PLW87948.1 TonB-dependent receptor [Halioglobus japonicus]GHD20221.1 TonB-dependent receptor [Halioglobus japonicus]
MTVFKPAVLSTAVASATLLLLPGLAQAQGQLEEVIVTAQKREQSMQDVPVAVTAFSAQQLEKSGVKDMFDLQVNAPSLRVGASQTSTTTTFAIRGVFTSSQNFGLEPSVGLYVDGVYRARQGSMINNLVDISSIEVLRGPQGTLFGRNTPAGAITMSTAMPDFEGTGFIEGTVGDYDLYGLSGAKSFTAIEDVLAFRVTGFGMQRDGYIDIVDGGDDVINDRDRWGARLQALYLPTDSVTVRVIADYSEVDETCCASGSFKNNFVAQDLPPGSAPVFGTDTNIVNIGGTVVDQDDFYDREVAVARPPVSQNEDSGLSVQIDWETDSFTLTSITAYREHDSFDDADIAFTSVDGAYRINDAEQNQFTQELRIANESDRFSYVAGLYYYEQELDNSRQTIVGSDLSGIIGLSPNAFIGGDGSFDVNTQDHTSYAAFGQVDYNITDDLILTAGLRWTYEDKDLENIYTDDAPPSLDFSQDNWGFYFFAPLTPQDDLSESFDDDRITGALKISWFMNDDVMLYASYGTGYKSGGVNADRIEEQFNPLFDAEESESYEVGMKADFPEQAMRLNLAIHRTDTDDLQTSSFQGGGFFLSNAGVAETYGLEADLYWAPTDSTTLTLGYAYNHGEYSDFENGPCWTGTPWHTGEAPPGLNEDGSCDISGGDLSGNAENVVVLTVNQDFTLSDTMTGFIYGEYSWVDDRMTDVNNDPVKYDGDYNLINVRAGLRYEPWDAYVTLWGRNLTDEEYTGTIADAPAQTGRFIAYYEEPRTWGLTLRKDF